MITVEDVRLRWEAALAALEEKRNATQGKVTFAPGTDASAQLQAFAGTVIMSLSRNGMTIDEESFTGALAVTVIMMKHYDIGFPKDGGCLTEFLTEEGINCYAVQKKHQLVAFASYILTSAIESAPDFEDSADKDGFADSVSAFCCDVVLFLIMHAMNEQSIIADIPSSIELKL